MRAKYNSMTRLRSLFSLLLIGCSTISAQQVIRLYEGIAPGSESWNWTEKENTQNLFNTRLVYNVTTPTITAFLPDPSVANGTAVVIAPGGGFHVLPMDSEGYEVARWLNSKGIAAFVLKYRLVKSETDDPLKEVMAKNRSDEALVRLTLQDGLAAMKYVRSHADSFHIKSDRIGFMGFSSGGTIAMSVAYNSDDSNRPDFLIPVYPFMPAVIGKDVPSIHTPAFIVAATDDKLGLAPQSVELYYKWVAAHQGAELHLYERGGHGFGMKHQDLPSDAWVERLGDWMKMKGLMSAVASYEQKSNDCAYFRQQFDQFRTDWANFNKYKEANMKVKASGKKPKAVFMGNSITEFWVYQDPAFFTENNFVGRGISGQTTPQMVLRFRPDVIDLHPEIVVINAGINDIAENTGPYNEDETMGNIISMVELAKANKIKVVLASIHPASGFPWNPELKGVPEKIISLNARIKKYAADNHLTYLDYHSTMKNERNGMNPDMAEDGVHPTLAGYKVMERLAKIAVR